MMTDSVAAAVQRMLDDAYWEDGFLGQDIDEYVQRVGSPRKLRLIANWPEYFETEPTAIEVLGLADDPNLDLGEPPDRSYLLELIDKVSSVTGTEIEEAMWLMELERAVLHPEISSVIAFPEQYFDHDPTAEEILDKALTFQAIALGSGPQ